MATFVEIGPRALDVEAIVRSVTAASTGAVSVFVGTTRDHFDGRRVLRLEYEAYEPMAKKELAKVCDKARERWNVHHVAVHHRLGVVDVTEASVVIAISSEHRKESLEAVAFVIDELKATVPIWKKEVYADGDGSWKENNECTWTASALAPIEVDNSEIQINASKEELDRRMEAFMQRKRQELDSSNVLEFCNRHVSDATEFSCARTDSVLVQRAGGQHSHLRQSNVVNPYGPQTQEALRDAPLSEAVRERLSALETKVLSREERPVAADVYARLRALEDRVSFLEGLSPEYVTRTGAPDVTDDDRVTTSIAGINSRIQELQAALTTTSNREANTT